jgi:enoyl-CoA hydratase/carnithine racemase
MSFETLKVVQEGGVLFADIAAPPMNLLGPELVRDLVSLILRAEGDASTRVLVLGTADPDYFLAHVDVTRIAEYRQEAAKLTGEADRRSVDRAAVPPPQYQPLGHDCAGRGSGSRGWQRAGAGLRHALCRARDGDLQSDGAGLRSPSGRGAQHLVRLMGRARALEVMLSAEDFDAELAERYGWINRALPAKQLGGFGKALAHRIAGFPAAGHAIVKNRVNAVALPSEEDFRRDSNLFGEKVREPEAQQRLQAALDRGFQTREAELPLATMLGALPER